MTDHVKRSFENDTIHLDNNTFRSCEFAGCTIYYSGGPWSVVDCSFSPPNLWQFGGAALETIELLKWLGKLTPDFAADIDSEGLQNV